MASKYDALGTYLRGQYGTEIPMTFAEIEAVLGFPLPPSARFRAWWSNNDFNNVMTKVWLTAGFRTARVDLEGKRLVFMRAKASEPMTGKVEFAEASAPGSTVQASMRHPAIGALKGMITIMPGVDLTEPADPEWGEIAYGD